MMLMMAMMMTVMVMVKIAKNRPKIAKLPKNSPKKLKIDQIDLNVKSEFLLSSFDFTTDFKS